MRTAKLVKIIKEIGNNNNRSLNERYVSSQNIKNDDMGSYKHYQISDSPPATANIKHLNEQKSDVHEPKKNKLTEKLRVMREMKKQLDERVARFSPDNTGDAEAQDGGLYGKDSQKLYQKGKIGQEYYGQPPPPAPAAAAAAAAAAVAQRNKPGPAGGSAADQFNASVAARQAAKDKTATGVSPTTVGVAAAAAGTAAAAKKAPILKALGAAGNVVGGALDYNDRRDKGDSVVNSLAGAAATTAVAKDNSKAAAEAQKRLDASTPKSAVAAAAAGTEETLKTQKITPPPANPNTDAPIAGVGKQPNADAPGEEPGAQTGPAPPAAPAAPAARPAAPAAPAARPAAPAAPAARPAAPAARPEAPKQDNITRSPFGGVTVNSKNSSSYDISEYTRSQKRVNMRTTKLIEMIKEIGKKRIDENRSRYSRTKTHLSMAGRYNRGQQLAQESNPGKTMTGKPADTIEMSPVANTTKLDR